MKFLFIFLDNIAKSFILGRVARNIAKLYLFKVNYLWKYLKILVRNYMNLIYYKLKFFYRDNHTSYPCQKVL